MPRVFLTLLWRVISARSRLAEAQVARRRLPERIAGRTDWLDRCAIGRPAR